MTRIILGVLSFFSFHMVNAQEMRDTVSFNQSVSVPLSDKSDEPRTRHYLSASVGPAWITSKVITDFGEYTGENGWEYSVDYSCVFRKGFGFGLSLTHNSTEYHMAGDMKQTYIGPSLVYEHVFSGRWKFHWDIGMGYVHYSDYVDKYGGLGMKMSLSMEYLLSDIVSLGFRVMSGSTTFSDDERYDGDHGISRFGVMASLGIRLY